MVREAMRAPTRRWPHASIVYAAAGVAAFTFLTVVAQLQHSTQTPTDTTTHSGARRRQLSVLQSPETCPPPIVNWAEFKNLEHGDRTAGVLAEDLTDPAVSFVVKGLLGRGYAVQLFIEDGMQRDAHNFCYFHELLSSVHVQLIKAHAYMLNATLVHMFVYMPMDESTIVAGRGEINWIIMPGLNAHSTTDDMGLALEAQSARRLDRRLFTQLDSSWNNVRRPGSFGTMTRKWRSDDSRGGATTAADVALSTYDFLLYRTTPDCTHHLKTMTATLERLQNDNKLFPLVDVLTIPDKDCNADARKDFQAKFDQMAHRSLLNKVFRFFLQNTLEAYKTRLTPTVHAARHARAAVQHKESRYAAVIVEARPHFAFLYSVLNAAWYLPGWTMHVVHSQMNAGFVKRVLSPHINVVYHQLDTDNMSIDDYNNLMKSRTFWESLDADYVLLYQTDAMILKYGAEHYTQFDYIGAPWHLENERWSKDPLKTQLPDGVGNGGFSMRSTRAMIAVCEEFSASSPLKEQEDVFFAVHIQQDARFKLGDRLSAYQFCLEVPCRDLPGEIPLALHAAWYYNDLPTLIRMLDASLYGLIDCN